MAGAASKPSKADLAKVLKTLNDEDSVGGHGTATVKTMLVEGLPFAVHAAAAHTYQAKVVGYTEQLLSEAKAAALKDKEEQQAHINQTGAVLEERRAEAAKAKAELEEAISEVKAKKAHIKELEAVAARGSKAHEARVAAGKGQQEAWAQLRQLAQEATALRDGPLQQLQQEEGDEDTRNAAAASVAGFLKERNAETVLQAASTPALAVKPSARGAFDLKAVEAASALVKGRVAQLDAQVADAEPEEHHLKAEIVGLWAIADCARDAVSDAKEALFQAEMAQTEKKVAHEEAEKRVKEQSALVTEHSNAKVVAEKKEHQTSEAIAALERLVKADTAVEEDATEEPPEKRARVEEKAAAENA